MFFIFMTQSNMRCYFLLERRQLLCKESALNRSQMLTSPFISTVYCELFKQSLKKNTLDIFGFQCLGVLFFFFS